MLLKLKIRNWKLYPTIYKIYIQNFHKFYIAVVVSGVMDAAFKSRLNDIILKLVKDAVLQKDNPDEVELKKKISQYFDKI